MTSRTLTEQDATMFNIMESLKRLSKCIDKQVVCLIVDNDGTILSIGVNKILKCDKNCDDKKNRTCVVNHAEIEAIIHLSDAKGIEELPNEYKPTAYVSLFPCAPCQLALNPYVKEIVTFGMIHKEWVSDKLFVYGHPIYDFMGPNLLDADTKTVNEQAEEIDCYEARTNFMKTASQIAHRDFYAELKEVAHKNMSERLEASCRIGVNAYTISNYKRKGA